MLQFPGPHADVLPADIPLVWPPGSSSLRAPTARIVGSLVGLAVGDALGASVEFRPRAYLLEHPITDLTAGGTWNLKTGYWTDDTSMALCLASSLITCKGFNPYDQMVRYKWWYKYGYLSSTGKCFDIGQATRDALEEFNHRQEFLKKYYNYKTEGQVDRLQLHLIKQARFDYHCGKPNTAGNGALMRLAPIPLVYHREPALAVELAGRSARPTHSDEKTIDANRYYAALIVAAVRGELKTDLLSAHFYAQHRHWFGQKDLHPDILAVAAGSYKRPNGYDDGIRGSGFVVRSLEAALWAFWSGKDFCDGALKAVNLGDDTDTTAAIYGQLAGAFYGYQAIPSHWTSQLYARNLIVCTARWLELIHVPSLSASPNKNINPFQEQRSRPRPLSYSQSVASGHAALDPNRDQYRVGRRAQLGSRPTAYQSDPPTDIYSRHNEL